MRPQFALKEIARYGWATLDDASGPLSERERQAGAGVLGHPTGVVEDPDGNLYVLDAEFQKIVVFGAGGDYEDVILGGLGRGPGEFIRPRALALSPNGRLWVNDQMEQRITEFDVSGRVIRVVKSPYALLDLAAVGEKLYATRLAVDSTARVVVFDTSGTVLATVLEPRMEDVDAGVPSAGGIGPAPRGRIVFAHQRIGRWRMVEGMNVGPVQGVALHPDARATQTRTASGAMRVNVPVDVWSAGGFPGGFNFVYYAAKLADEAERSFRLALFDSAGAHLQTITVPADGGTFGHSLKRREIFVRQDDPVPRIVRFRLVPVDAGPMS